MENRWCGKITLSTDDVFNILDSYDRNHIKLEDLVEYKINNKFPENISKEDKAYYIGTISSLLWNYYRIDNIPESITINQKTGGNFVINVKK